MNIQIQLCGLCILFLLIIFLKSHRTLRLYKEKVFYMVLYTITVSLILDILSLASIHFRHIFPLRLVNFLCKSYIITLIWGACSALIYVITDLVSEAKHRRITRLILVLVCIQSAVVYFLPIHIYDNGVQVYTYGISVLTVYLFVALYIIATLTAAWVFRKRLNSRRGFAIVLWMVIWIAAALIQFLNSALLIVGFASALGVLILFVLMENPEANLDRRLGCFNAYALTEYLKQLYEHELGFSVLEISFDSTALPEGQGFDTNEVMQRIIHILDRGGNYLVFKSINLSLVLISQDHKSLEAVSKVILSAFTDMNSIQDAAGCILVPRADAFSGMEELFRFLSFVRTSHRDERGVLITADEAVVIRYREQYLMEQEIADALAENRVEVFYQPIYSTGEQCFASAEALVRIRTRDGELLSPGRFIPIAEENGQILELGERVFEKVCRFLKETEAISLGLRYVEVNLSVLQCEKTDLSERLISIISQYGVSPGLINLEITETASISARKTLLENMRQLIDYGFTFSLDDSGKGESNLMYVVEMPVSIVKLDYDLSKAFFQSPKARHVVQAVIGMAHGMGLKLVAEGIETDEEFSGMNCEGIDYIQGFYYSKPLSEANFLEFLRSRS
ncbi:MAG: EAL domain-containing protein [Clostridiales bacterium]|nr:EAL domain-containing protein [Clostridiales bacterium]